MRGSPTFFVVHLHTRSRPRHSVIPMNPYSLPHRRHWLDLLPPDVCERIASYVSPGTLTNSLRSLAATSPHLRCSVLSLLSFKFDVHSLRSKCTPWIPLLRPNIFELHFVPSDGRLPTSISGDDIISLLAAPNLRQAAIPDHPDFLNALARFRSVRHLTVWVASERSRELLFKTISCLTLEELVLEYRPFMPTSVCLCEDGKYFKRDYDALTAACPNLKALTVKCRCCTTGSDHPILRLLPRLPALTKVGFVMRDFPDIPASSLERLRSLQSVSIETPPGPIIPLGPGAGHRLAVLIRSPVTVLTIDECLGTEEIKALTKCPRLSKLDFKIAPDAEWVLAEVVDKFPALRSLTLRWPTSAPWERRFAPLPGEAPHLYHIEAAPGAVLAIVEAAHDLCDLSLIRVHMQLPEIDKVLEKMGAKLRSLALSLRDHDEQEKCLHYLLWSLVKYNHNLRALNIVGVRPTPPPRRRRRRVSNDSRRVSPNASEIASLHQSCMTALARLERNVPEIEANLPLHCRNCTLSTLCLSKSE